MASRAGNHTELLTLPRGGQGAGRRAPNGGIPARVVGGTGSLMRWGPVCGGAKTPRAPAPPAAAPLPAAVRAAREVLSTFGLASPVDVDRIASLLGYPVEWVRRPPSERGGIARQAG